MEYPTGMVRPGAAKPSIGGVGPQGQPASASSRAVTTRTLLFASQKGGVGKTASAVNVAVCLAQMGHRVLLVDTDPIGSVSASFGTHVAPGHPGLYGLMQWDLADLVIPDVAMNLDLLPYAQDGRAIDLNLLHRAIGELNRQAASQYQFVIVDSRPSVADMTRRLCQVVDEVLVVVQCHPLAYRTLGGILAQLRDARADGAEARLRGLLLTMVDESDAMQRQLEAHIRHSLGQSVLPMSIPLDRTVGEGLLADLPVVIHQPDSPSAQAYRSVAEHLLGAM